MLLLSYKYTSEISFKKYWRGEKRGGEKERETQIEWGQDSKHIPLHHTEGTCRNRILEKIELTLNVNNNKKKSGRYLKIGKSQNCGKIEP